MGFPFPVPEHIRLLPPAPPGRLRLRLDIIWKLVWRRKRLFLFIVAAGFLLAVFLYTRSILPCGEGYIARLWRAIQTSVSARGNTFLGLIAALAYPIAEVLHAGPRTFRQKGLRGLFQLIKKHFAAKTLSVAGAVWI